MGLRSIGGLAEFVIMVAVVLCVWAYWRIFTKAGYPGAMGIMMVIPFLNVIMLFFLAFSEWPVLKELKALRERVPTLWSAADRGDRHLPYALADEEMRRFNVPEKVEAESNE
jgi:heme/copper-type cytochrome/quinol oxidase subunit 2